jgi:acetyltransferase-like isoleucine patch superfamily enzyme
MNKLSIILKRLYKSSLRYAWIIGGQKEHRSTGKRVPINGFISNEVVIVFPEQVNLGEGAMLMSGARLICAGMPPYLEAAGSIEIGADSIVREGAILQTYGGRIKIGSACTINPYCLIQGNGNVDIGNNTLIASHVCIYSANHNFSDPARPIRAQGETRKGVVIGNDVWIGGGVIILDGVTIGDGAVVAAGAVIKRDVAAGTIVAGVPGRQVGSRC